MAGLRYRLGFLGAWALFLVAAGLASLAAAALLGNWKDARLLRRLEAIDLKIAARLGPKAGELRQMAQERERYVRRLRSDVARSVMGIDESQESDQTIVVSTAENRLSVRSGRRTIFQAVCSTGKGKTLADARGRRARWGGERPRIRIATGLTARSPVSIYGRSDVSRDRAPSRLDNTSWGTGPLNR